MVAEFDGQDDLDAGDLLLGATNRKIGMVEYGVVTPVARSGHTRGVAFPTVK